MQRIATAVWNGAPRSGHGFVSTASGSIHNLRFSDLPDGAEKSCTTPCELLAAAHASCITLTLAQELAAAGHAPELIETDAVLTIQLDDQGWHPTLAYVDLRVRANLPEATLKEIAHKVVTDCPVSRLFRPSTEVTTRIELLPVGDACRS